MGVREQAYPKTAANCIHTHMVPCWGQTGKSWNVTASLKGALRRMEELL